MSHVLSIGAIFNNEAPYLKEWLDHYINRGVDHFYLINDNSDDNFREVLEPYEDVITLFDINERYQFLGRQDFYYNKFFKRRLPETKWLIICDIDEYIWSPKFLDLKQACNCLQESNIYSLTVPMILFGSNNHIQQPPSIVQGFTKRSIMNEDYLNFVNDYSQYKSVVWASEVLSLGIHSHWVECKTTCLNSLNLNLELFRLNHYRLQSEEKWRKGLEKFDVNNYQPKNSANASPQLGGELNKGNKETHNYRTMDMFYNANKTQNKIEDYGLVDQNRKYNL